MENKEIALTICQMSEKQNKIIRKSHLLVLKVRASRKQKKWKIPKKLE